MISLSISEVLFQDFFPMVWQNQGRDEHIWTLKYQIYYSPINCPKLIFMCHFT
jgi:hypothetical protein